MEPAPTIAAAAEAAAPPQPAEVIATAAADDAAPGSALTTAGAAPATVPTEAALVAVPAVPNALAALQAPEPTTSGVKHKRTCTMEQFTVADGTGANDGFVVVTCNHCEQRLSRRAGKTTDKAALYNVKRMGDHMLSSTRGKLCAVIWTRARFCIRIKRSARR